jgi:hypothetical protein
MIDSLIERLRIRWPRNRDNPPARLANLIPETHSGFRYESSKGMQSNALIVLGPA